MLVLVHIDSLRGILHAVKVDKYIDNLFNSSLRPIETKTLAGSEGSCSSDIFNVNCCYVDRSDLYDYDDVA